MFCDLKRIHLILALPFCILISSVCFINTSTYASQSNSLYSSELVFSVQEKLQILTQNAPMNSEAAQITPYFKVVFSGNGVDHMNINLVNLKMTGLEPGDEIGVFDSIYCVGSATLSVENIEDNTMSIPASANDANRENPNGFFQGNKITMKMYRKGTVYKIYFETVNNSINFFESGGSMFAFVNFALSTSDATTKSSNEVIIYPNPFNEFVTIEIILGKPQFVICEILDMTGKLIIPLFKGETGNHTTLIWDGKDSANNPILPGIYLCRLNQSISKIIYKGSIN